MKWQPLKPNTKPIYILPKNTNIYPNFDKGVLKIPIKYQENTKKFGTEIPNTDLVFGIFLVYQIFGFRLTSLVEMHVFYQAPPGQTRNPTSRQVCVWGGGGFYRHQLSGKSKIVEGCYTVLH